MTQFFRWTAGVHTLDHATLTAYAPYPQTSWQAVLLQARDYTGKHYFEVQHLTGLYLKTGLHNANNSNYWLLGDFRGGTERSPTCTAATVGAYAQYARIMVAYDLDLGRVWFGVNGVWFASGDPASNLNPTLSDIASFNVGNPVYPAIQMLGGSSLSARFYPDSADWLYAPSGFSEATEFELNDSRLNQNVRIDTEDGGPYRIIEGVTEMLSPIGPRRVRLCDQKSGRCIREQWSDPVTGEVDFQNLREGPWVLYALDHTDAPTFEAEAISDRIATLSGERP